MFLPVSCFISLPHSQASCPCAEQEGTIRACRGCFLPNSFGKGSALLSVVLFLEYPSFPLSFFRSEGKTRACNLQNEVSHKLGLPESQCSAAKLVGGRHLYDFLCKCGRNQRYFLLHQPEKIYLWFSFCPINNSLCLES